MKAAVLLLVSTTIALATATGIFGPGPPRPPCVAGFPNATKTSCGNVCENSCEYMGDQIPHHWFELPSVFCIPGCSCTEGYVRNKDFQCVPQRRDSCDTDPCENVPHTLWKRCVKDSGPTCFEENCVQNGYNIASRCACKPGYGLDLKGKCVKVTSSKCKRLSMTKACLTPPPAPPME